MKLNKAQKRVLIWMPLVLLLIASVFALLEWAMGGDQGAIVKAFCSALIASVGGALFAFTSVLINWPWKLKDEENNKSHDKV